MLSFKKIFFLNDLILDAKLDYLFLTETWLGTDAPFVLTKASPPGFTFSFYAQGGDSVSKLNNSLGAKEILFEQGSSFEHHGFAFNN